MSKSLILLSGLILLLAQFSYGSEKRGEGPKLSALIEGLSSQIQISYQKYQSTGIPRLIVTTWEENLRVGRQILYVQDQSGRLEANSAQTLSVPAGFMCANLLEASQVFALKIMQANKYITAEQTETLIRLGDKLDGRQFRFFELTGVIDDPTARQDITPTEGKVSLGASIWMREQIGKTEATLWTVAGQVTSQHVRKQNTLMPWQLDPNYEHLRLDREVYPTTWEVGRVAQQAAGGHATLSAMAALSMVRELMIRGEPLKNGFVFVHSLGAVQNRLFKRDRVPGTDRPMFTVYHAHEPGRDEVLVASLADFLKALPPDQISHPVKVLMEASGQKLSWWGALEHMFAVEKATRVDVDMVIPSLGPAKQPVVLENATPEREVFVNLVSLKHNVVQEIPRLYPLLATKPMLIDASESFRNQEDPGASALVKDQLFSVTNLDPEVAATHPDYIKLMLMAAYFYYANQIETQFPHVSGYILGKLRIAITQQDDRITRQAFAIAGVERRLLSWSHVNVELQQAASGEISLHPQIKARAGTVAVFPAPLIRRMITDEPRLAREARRAFRDGNSQILQMLRGAF